MKVLPWSRRVAPHFVDTSITVLVIIAAGSVIWKHLGASALRNWRESPPTAAKISIPLPSALPLVPAAPRRPHRRSSSGIAHRCWTLHHPGELIGGNQRFACRKRNLTRQLRQV